MKKLINLTPDTLNIHLEKSENVEITDGVFIQSVGKMISIPPSETEAKVSFDSIDHISRVPIKMDTDYGTVNVWSYDYEKHIENLPEPKEDTFYIVYKFIQVLCPNRKDLLSLETPIRDADENIVGYKGFITN